MSAGDGDRLDPLTLNQPLRASGTICLRRGVSDSTTLIGFFHATGSMRKSDAQRSAISGVSIDEESINLMDFQRQYQAASKIISVADQLTQELMQLV